MVVNALNKPKTQAGKRYLKDHAPKLIENDKQCILFNGRNASQVGQDFFRALHSYKRNSSQYLKYGKKNCVQISGESQSKLMDFSPFEDMEPIERICKKHDASLFGVVSHTKKRPHNLVLGRMYNHQLLDMVECGIEDFKGLMEFKNAKVAANTKPCLIFSGVDFYESFEHMNMKSILTDFFQGPEVTAINLGGFELAIQFISHEDKIIIKFYRIKLLKSGCESPRVELEEIGPAATLTMRRNKLASQDHLKLACRKPKELKVRKKKNISRTALGTTMGTVHMQKQDYGTLQIRKTPAIKKAKQEKLLQKKLAKQAANAIAAQE